MSRDIPIAVDSLRQYQPVSWAHIPDLGLYMDQVITFISRIYEPLYGENIQSYLSSSMINNYVKSKLIPRPTGKKYSREQIALLTMIVALKQTCSMEDIRRLLPHDEPQTVKALYEAFNLRFSNVIKSICGEAKPIIEAPETALDFAILASGYSVGCATMLKCDPDQVQ